MDGGSGKSWAIADKLVMDAVRNPDLQIIALREIQRSIKYSSKKLIEDRIESLGVSKHFQILENEIRNTQGSGIFIFNGLQTHTSSSIKSLEGFDVAFVEEAQTISDRSLELLIPTIRAKGSKLYFTWNPHHDTDPIELLAKDKDNSVTIFANYFHNPYCPEAILQEANEMKIKSFKKYNHIYLGGFGVAEGVIFDNVTSRVIREKEIVRLECLQGMDFGYSNDPTAFCQIYIDHAEREIYVYEGFYKKKLLNSDIAREVKDLKCHRHLTRCDSAEPKTIASLAGKGLRVLACEKGKDSIVAGINFLLEYKITVNAHLTFAVEEFDNYTWELDKITGKPTNKPIDDFNHFIDALRYSVSHLYKRRGNTAGVLKPRGL